MVPVKSFTLPLLLLLAAVGGILALNCYECDSSEGDASCLQNTVTDSWKSTECPNKIPELDFEIRPSIVRCVHVSYVEDNVVQLERKCGFQGLCELIDGLNRVHLFGNVTEINCHVCNTTHCNLVGDPRKIVFRNDNKL